MQVKQLIKRIKSSDIASRLVSGAFWSIAGRVVGSGFLLLALIGVARIVGVETYGELSMVRSTIIMFSAFAGAGIGLTASRYIALYRNTNQTKAHEIYLISYYFSIGFGFFIATLLFFFAPLIAERSLQAIHLTSEIRLGAIALFFIALNSAQGGVLTGLEKFKTIAVNIALQGVVQAVLLIAGAYYFGINGVVGGMVFGALLLCGLHYRAIQKSIPKRELKNVKISKDTASVLWKFSLPAALSSILVIPVLWWCKTFVVQQSGFKAMANYDVAEQWSLIILFIPSAIAGMVIAILSNTLAEGTAHQYKKIININIWINAAISIFASLILCLLAVLILRSYGVGFTDVATFRILIISTIPNAIAAVLGQVIASKGKMWSGFMLNFLWAIWLLLLTLLFVKYLDYGAFGLALAVLCAYILHAIFSYTYMWQKVIKSQN